MEDQPHNEPGLLGRIFLERRKNQFSQKRSDPTGPATGLLADRFGYAVVFLIGGLAASTGFGLVITIARKERQQTT